MSSGLRDLCTSGALDKLHDELGFLISLKVVTEADKEAVFRYVIKNGMTKNVEGLLELIDWIKQLWTSYLKYSSFPKDILNEIKNIEELNHISTNYIEYIDAKDINYVGLDLSEFSILKSHLDKYFPKATFTPMIADIYDRLQELSSDNISEIISELYTVSQLLDYESNFDKNVIQRIRGYINRIRLQLEQFKPRNRDSFEIFLDKEEIIETVSFIINKIKADRDSEK